MPRPGVSAGRHRRSKNDGRQYVTVMAGWGGAWGQRFKAEGTDNVIDEPGRVFTFVLGGDAPSPVGTHAPEAQVVREPYVPDASWSADPEALASGDDLFHQHCARCHGAQAVSTVGAVPDLRYASPEVHERFAAIVLDGLRASGGMPAFGGRLSAKQVGEIRACLVSRSISAAIAGESDE